MRARLGFAAALAAGVLHTAAFAPTGLWGLQILALAFLASLVFKAGPRRAALLGFGFALGWLASGLWWLYISMHDFGHIPAVAAVAAVLLLAIFLSLHYAAAMALAAWLGGRCGAAWRVPVFAAAWLLAELSRAVLFSGFPWIASGYAHTVGPLARFAPWIGVYGISALAAAAAAALVLRAWRPMLAVAALVLAAWLAPQDFTAGTGRLKVSLLQPDVPQDEKFNPELMDANLELLTRQIESARGQLVITPETVVPLPWDVLPQPAIERMQRAAAAHPLLVGTFLGDEQSGYVNSMITLGGSSAYAYGKRHLLPFGEFLPTGFHWFVELMGIPMVDQATGKTQAPLLVQGQRLRPLICYEDLFGEDFVQSAIDGPDAADIFINVSNLAWFGELMVQDQHLQFSQMRALEFQRPFVRATNTGATAVLDHQGRVTARLPAATRGVLEAEVEGRRGSTPYARWLAACGLWPLSIAALAVLLAAGLRRRAS
jgi:apolipoprotein N-acyltransferase